MSGFCIPPEWVALVKEAETWRPEPYLDPVGLPTIGYGHRIDSLDHAEITMTEGEILLHEDLERACDAAIAASPVLLKVSPKRCAAVADFCFNVGPAKYATSTLKKRVDEEAWALAAKENARWVHGTDQYGNVTVLPGLVKRRAITSTWLEEG